LPFALWENVMQTITKEAYPTIWIGVKSIYEEYGSDGGDLEMPDKIQVSNKHGLGVIEKLLSTLGTTQTANVAVDTLDNDSIESFESWLAKNPDYMPVKELFDEIADQLL
jgi:hypothetical protein